MPRDIDSMLNDRLSGKSKKKAGFGNGLSSGSSSSNRGGGSRTTLSSSAGLSLPRKSSKSCLKSSASMAVMGGGGGMGNRKLSMEQRSISFDKFRRVREIEHINDIPESQRNALWMKPEESKRIRQNAIKIVDQLNAGQRPVEGHRGLEGHTEEATERRYELRENVYDAVLGIQDYQREAGLSMADVIANVYRQHSQQAQLEAQEKAMIDTMEVLSLQNSLS